MIKKQPRKNASIPREGYIAALDLAKEMLAGHHKLKAMELEEGPGHFTKFEAIARTVTSILRRNDKGRVVIEYDPADDRVKFYELFPETETEQPGGNSMTDERVRMTKTYAELADMTLTAFMEQKNPDRMAELADIYLAFAERDDETEPTQIQSDCRKVAERMEQKMLEEMYGGPESKPMQFVFPYLAARQIAEEGRKKEREAKIYHVPL